jgi:glycosyltransferase involved in cell wall biosynthesis
MAITALPSLQNATFEPAAIPQQSDRRRTSRPRQPRVSVVVPTLNEEKNIGWVLSRLPADLHEVILVDGRSVDGTVATARQIRRDVRVLNQPARGKGAALAMGLANVTGDIAVMIDADGSMDPAEIPGLVGALLSGADVVKGSRATAGGGSHDLSLLRKIGNWGLTFVANRLYKMNWRELCYGYAAFWADVLPLLDVHGLSDGPPAATNKSIEYGHGFEIEAVLFCRSARAQLRVAEVFSFEHERRHGESNLATWRDGWRVLTAIVKERRYRQSAPVLRHLRRYPLMPELVSAELPTAA